MINKNLSDEELDFLELLHDPIAFAECTFSNFDDLSSYKEDKFSHVRNAQIPLLSHEYTVRENPEFSEKEMMELRETAGNVYSLAGRNLGKSMSQKLDIPMSLVLHDGWNILFSSYDDDHISRIMDVVLNTFDYHPILKSYKKNSKKRPYKIETKNGASLESVNMTIKGNDPGHHFFGYHVKKIIIEEISFETKQVYDKRVDARHETGCIERAFGMANYTRHSPIGEIMNDISYKHFWCNIPQYANPNFTEKEEKEAIKKYGGINTPGFLMFVRAKSVETGLSVFDMERVRSNYDPKERNIINFQITKHNFNTFKNDIFIEKPKQSDQILVASDIGGDLAPSEIVIFSRIEDKFHYLYNITTVGLTDEQQYEVFSWIIEQLSPHFVSLDTSEGTGRAIFRRLEKKYGKENLGWVSFAEKITIGFKTNDKGKVIRNNKGEPEVQEEYVSEWSVRYLQNLFYDNRFFLPIDYKLDKQINKLTSTTSGNRTIYKSLAEENHLFQAMQVLAITIWKNEFNIANPISKKKFFKGGC